jgi:hypothetical protein
MKTRIVLVSVLMMFIFGSSACSSEKTVKGTIIGVDATLPLNALLGSAGQSVDSKDITYGDTVTVEAEDGKQYKAFWDEKLLGKPVSFKLTGAVVTIKQKPNEPDVWEVTKIISEP